MNTDNLKEKLIKCKNINFDDVDINDLEDITKINFSKKQNNQDKIIDFIKSSKNPYMFQCNGKKIQIAFANTGNHSYVKRELVKQHLEEKNLEKHEYTNLVNIIYQFAKSEDDEGELIIGNVMRRVLEAFSTFEYRKSIQDVSNDKSILNTIS